MYTASKDVGCDWDGRVGAVSVWIDEGSGGDGGGGGGDDDDGGGEDGVVGRATSVVNGDAGCDARLGVLRLAAWLRA